MTNVDELSQLNGRSVLVTSEQEREHNPQAGLRGTIRVVGRSDDSESLRVEIVIDLPDMENRPAVQKVLSLNDEEVERLLASEVSGTYALRTEQALTSDQDSVRPEPI